MEKMAVITALWRTNLFFAAKNVAAIKDGRMPANPVTRRSERRFPLVPKKPFIAIPSINKGQIIYNEARNDTDDEHSYLDPGDLTMDRDKPFP